MQEQSNILVVDDEHGIRITLAGILEDEGYNVIVAENGYQGIVAAEKTNFKIAFIDMKMPGINGIETFKKIKEISPDTIIFFMTAFLAEDTLNEAAKLETQAILYKPLDMELILKILKEDLTKTTILIVDDESAIRDALQEVLEVRGYKVYVASNGYAAIQIAKSTHFDIMFIDVVMPGIDGFQTLEEIRKIDPKIKVVLMTGQDIEHLVAKATAHGASTCVPKPVDDVDKLLELLQTIKEETVQTATLVVDDDISSRETLKEILQKNGYKTYAVKDGLTAIQLVKKTHFDVVFIDVKLPGMDGFQTLEEIKKIDPVTNAIMMTGQNIDNFADQVISRGAFAHLTKPVDPSTLLQLTISAIYK
jgi:CheY-like chemotaxis protein